MLYDTIKYSGINNYLDSNLASVFILKVELGWFKQEICQVWTWILIYIFLIVCVCTLAYSTRLWVQYRPRSGEEICLSGLMKIEWIFSCLSEIGMSDLACCQHFKSTFSNNIGPTAKQNEWYPD